jgi:hypothetical protein
MGDNKSPGVHRGRRNGRPEGYQTSMAFKRPDHTKAVWQMVNTFGLQVWDEQNDRLVGFGAVKNQAQTYPSP